ncbi:MAG TPA: hypothetical protein PKC30_16940 [Saprospiraceae bacterium]|nr:hypothetical protein [Saprospiraceae bacterium]
MKNQRINNKAMHCLAFVLLSKFFLHFLLKREGINQFRNDNFIFSSSWLLYSSLWSLAAANPGSFRTRLRLALKVYLSKRIKS